MFVEHLDNGVDEVLFVIDIAVFIVIFKVM